MVIKNVEFQHTSGTGLVPNLSENFDFLFFPLKYRCGIFFTDQALRFELVVFFKFKNWAKFHSYQDSGDSLKTGQSYHLRLNPQITLDKRESWTNNLSKIFNLNSFSCQIRAHFYHENWKKFVKEQKHTERI